MIILAPDCDFCFAGVAISHACIRVSRMKHVENPFALTACLNCFFRSVFILKFMFVRARVFITKK